jgi:TetR/AcrR family tetracycline transcriptional repressor
VSSPFLTESAEKAMTDDQSNLPPPWWRVESRRGAREARREARQDRRQERRAARHGEAAPHEPITPERIADAALRLIDTQGLSGLTVRALAEELGLGTMTLYWYVRNKDEVLDLVADRVFAAAVLPQGETDWRELCRAGAKAVRAAFLAHPRAVPIIVGRGSFGPNGLRMIEFSIGIFRGAGFSPEEATDAYFTISNFVTGFCSFETAGADPGSGLAFDRQAYARMASQYVSMLPADRYPNVVAAAPRMFGADRDARFAFGIDCLIAGLEARLNAGRAAGN